MGIRVHTMRTRICVIEGCGKPCHGLTWCGMHYRRNLYKGSPLAPNLNNDPQATFWSYVDKSGECWVWTGCIGSKGYGKWKTPRGFPISSWGAHRVAYFLTRGPIPEATPCLDHLCRVRCCVNPDHLEPVTLAENLRRGKALITHCPRGHEYVPGNLLATSHRACKTCHRDRERIRRAGAHG